MAVNEPNDSEPRNIDELLYPPENDPDKEDFYITRTEFEQISEAFKKDEGFRKLFVEYVEEMQDPETQATYQKEMRQLELERGNVIHFINPVACYVLKTSINGEQKGFINICSNPLIRKADFQTVTKNNEKGNMWSIPFAQSPPRDDCDKSGSYCVVYDVIFNPETIHFAKQDKMLRDKLESTAIESVENSFKVTLDKNNVKIPKIKYKGLPKATSIKYKIGDNIPSVIDPAAIKNEIPPQRMHPLKKETGPSTSAAKAKVENSGNKSHPQEHPEKTRSRSKRYDDNEDETWTEPRYSIKYRSHVDMQDYTLDNRKTKTTPDELILTIDLPLLRDSSTLDADVVEGGNFFVLKSEVRAKYRLKLKLPFQVYGDSAKATFDKDKRKLTVIMKVLKKVQLTSESRTTPDIQLISEPLHQNGVGGAGDAGSDLQCQTCNVNCV